MKTIATFGRADEAQLCRTRLEAAGIPAFVPDEHSADWHCPNALGAVRVQVADEDAEAASEFLAADSPQPCPDAEEAACPACGSREIAPRELSWWIWLPLLLVFFLFPLPVGRARLRCASCRHVFRLSQAAGTTHFRLRV